MTLPIPDPDSIPERLERVEKQLKAVISSQQSIEEQLGSVGAVLAAGKGAFQVLDFISRIAKPILWLGAVIAGIAALIANHRVP